MNLSISTLAILDLDMSILVLDFETSIQTETRTDGKKIQSYHGPSWRDPRNDIYTIIYGTNESNVKVLHSKKGFKRRLPYRVKKLLETTSHIVGVNLKFDLGYIWHDPALQQWLLNGGQVWDVQLVHYLLSGMRHNSPSLSDMQACYLNKRTKPDVVSKCYKKLIGADNMVQKNKQCPRFWAKYNEYAIQDGTTPIAIMRQQLKIVTKLGMEKIVKLYNQDLLSLLLIEQTGMHIDVPKAEKLRNKLHLKRLELIEKAESVARKYWDNEDLPPLNINSPAHKSAILFGGAITATVRRWTGEYFKGGKTPGAKKYKNYKETISIKGMQVDPALSVKTKTGNYQCGEDIINRIAKDTTNQDAIKFCEYFKLAGSITKAISTYIDHFIDGSIDGVLYPNFNQCITRTSRLSSSKPNVQNLPKSGKFYKIVQGLIIPPDDDWICASYDFSQLEVCIQALVSNDTNLVNDINNGVDFHIKRMCWKSQEITYEQGYKLCKIDKDPYWIEQRKQAKPIGFGKAYGKHWKTMAADTGIPEEQVKAVYDAEDDAYPVLAEYEKNVAETVKHNQKPACLKDIAKKYHAGVKHGDGVGHKFNKKGQELLPIRIKGGSYTFDPAEIRHIGYYQSITGKLYSWDEFAVTTHRGDIFRYYKPTQIKNYTIQGTAQDVQAITTVALFKLLLKHPDKVRMINEVHDSKIFYIKKSHFDLINDKISTIITNTDKLLYKRFGIKSSVKFSGDCEAGPNMYELKGFRND